MELLVELINQVERAGASVRAVTLDMGNQTLLRECKVNMNLSDMKEFPLSVSNLKFSLYIFQSCGGDHRQKMNVNMNVKTYQNSFYLFFLLRYPKELTTSPTLTMLKGRYTSFQMFHTFLSVFEFIP